MEKAARLAANSELTQSASIRLLDELMEVTIGEHLEVQSVETYIQQWLRSKKATGTSSGDSEPVRTCSGRVPSVALREMAENFGRKHNGT